MTNLHNNLQNITNLQLALASAGIGLTAGLFIAWYIDRKTIFELEEELIKVNKELIASQKAVTDMWASKCHLDSNHTLSITRSQIPLQTNTDRVGSDSGDTVTQSDYQSFPSVSDFGAQTDSVVLVNSDSQTDSVTLVDSESQTDLVIPDSVPSTPVIGLITPTASSSSTVGADLGNRFQEFHDTGVQTEYYSNSVEIQTEIKVDNAEVQTEFQVSNIGTQTDSVVLVDSGVDPVSPTASESGTSSSGLGARLQQLYDTGVQTETHEFNNTGVQTELTSFSRIFSIISNLVRTPAPSEVQTTSPIETPTTNHVENWRLKVDSFNPSPISEGRAASIAVQHRSVSELGTDEEVTSSAIRSYEERYNNEPVSYESTELPLPIPNKEMVPISPSTVSEAPLPVPTASVSSELPLPIPNRDLLPVYPNSESTTTVSDLPLPIPNVEMEPVASMGEQITEIIEIVTGSSQ